MQEAVQSRTECMQQGSPLSVPRIADSIDCLRKQSCVASNLVLQAILCCKQSCVASNFVLQAILCCKQSCVASICGRGCTRV